MCVELNQGERPMRLGSGGSGAGSRRMRAVALARRRWSCLRKGRMERSYDPRRIELRNCRSGKENSSAWYREE
jgi:hypothetical protein